MNAEAKNLPRAPRARVQEITIHTDSRDILAAAARDQKQLGLKDYFIVDVDSHHVETDSWDEVLAHIEDPVLRYNGQAIAANWPIAQKMALHNEVPGLMFQDCQGRIPHQATLAEPVDETDVHRDVTLIRRGMDSIGFDLQVVFPQPMLEVGLHPIPEIAAQLVMAYNRWFAKDILPKDSRMRSLLALPFEDPAACLRTIREHADNPSVLGFMITSQRHAGVHRNEYMPIYRELEERGLPLAFHAGPTQFDTMTSTMNRFLSVHAMSFVTCNMTHMTNWIINGLPERFPKLKVMWVESGLAWLPFMMQRLDTEYLKRQSDAPALKRRPSEYMQDMYYTTQPMEDSHPELLEATLKAIKADTQLMYSSDWPHWDFDLPGGLFSLPFVDEQARRNILGETARKLFNL
jgi:predicted TIM-barrel fold metal-dependent hydrolase